MYCTNCGSKVEDTAKFCSNCGAATRNVSGTGYSSQQAGISPQAEMVQNNNVNQQPKPTYTPPSNLKPPSKAPAAIVAIICGLLMIGFIVAYVAIIYFVTTESVSGLSVTDVKTSYITNLDEDNSIGDVFEDYSYFDDTEWSAYE